MHIYQCQLQFPTSKLMFSMVFLSCLSHSQFATIEFGSSLTANLKEQFKLYFGVLILKRLKVVFFSHY